MDITISIPDEVVETVVKGIMQNFPEASEYCVLECVDWHYGDELPASEWKLTFVDTEDDNRRYEVTVDKLKATFHKLFTTDWTNAFTTPPLSGDEEEWDDWLCNADANDFDAFIQLACLGEIRYS